MDFEKRRDIERRIVSKVITDLQNAGFALSVDDGEEITVDKSIDHATVLDAMFTTDIDWLRVYEPVSGIQLGWVMFVYGNDGYDVMSDYTTNLEDHLAGATALADQLEEQYA